MVAECNEILKKRNDGSYAKYYGDMVHGWMGARANLKDEKELAGYEKGYKELVTFFNTTLA